MITEINVHVGTFPAGLFYPGFLFMPDAYEHLKDYRNLSWEKFQSKLRMHGWSGGDIVCNHPFIVDLFHPTCVIVHNGANHAQLSLHREIKKWSMLTSGEFWSFVGEGWVI